MSDRTLGLVAKTPQRVHPNKTELKTSQAIVKHVEKFINTKTLQKKIIPV